ncbi:unnamed protein product [Allacma fusca]|uniref:Uncharacterized protein n=1 Tax=Allacma fusca TaxID=39272 RepID=A0A8J2PA52_9HEXA|nr:unnamed protein product [Allacma fusca]
MMCGWEISVGTSTPTVTSTLDNNDTRFWDFSWHEIRIYEVPAMVDDILRATEEPDLFYVAQSMGNSVSDVYVVEDGVQRED